MIDGELRDLMTTRVTWSTGAAMSNYGVPTWSTSGRSMVARVTFRDGAVRDLDGIERAQQGIVWCASTANSTWAPTSDDRLTLADGRTPPVLRVETYVDERADTHHHRVSFGY